MESEGLVMACWHGLCANAHRGKVRKASLAGRHVQKDVSRVPLPRFSRRLA